MANKKLIDEFHEETGLYHYDTSKMDFKWNDKYIEWLEEKLSKLRQGAVRVSCQCTSWCVGQDELKEGFKCENKFKHEP